jgi:ribonuclease Z
MLDISLLGCGGMMPLHNRYLTALLVRCNGRMLLVDCGEGTQMTMRELGWGFVNLDYILITHFHADHIAGLPGMLLSLSNYGRTEPLTIIGPDGIERVVKSLQVIAPELLYPVRFMELHLSDNSPVQFQLGEFQISALRLSHALTCIGYSIYIPRRGKFDPLRATAQCIPKKYWKQLQNGEAVGIYTPDMVLGPPRKAIKVSYITDTKPINSIPAFIEGSDLFICEGMYGSDEFKEKAVRYFHMVFSDAARLARAGQVGELWLTHFSPALTDPESYLPEVKAIFDNTIIGFDRMIKTLKFENIL